MLHWYGIKPTTSLHIINQPYSTPPLAVHCCEKHLARLLLHQAEAELLAY